MNSAPTRWLHGGLVKVGERGTEIVHLPDQSRISPNAAGLASMGGNAEIHVHMEGASFIGNLPENVAQTIAEAVSERIGIEASLAERMPQG